jgi:hypothetical protein
MRPLQVTDFVDTSALSPEFILHFRFDFAFEDRFIGPPTDYVFWN